jgi:hypothetical protein
MQGLVNKGWQVTMESADLAWTIYGFAAGGILAGTLMLIFATVNWIRKWMRNHGP